MPAEKNKNPLPEGYVCNACGAVGQHAIYNCPSKKKGLKKGSNQDSEESKTKVDNDDGSNEAKAVEEEKSEVNNDVDDEAAKEEGAAGDDNSASNNDSNSNNKPTAFISGLPFWFSRRKLLALLEEKQCSEGVTFRDVKIVTFEDNPRKCKGLAYVSCSEEAQLSNIIKVLHDSTIDGKLKLSVVPSSTERNAHRSGPSAATTTGSKRKRRKQRPQQGDNSADGEEDEQQQRRCYRCGGKHDPKDCTNERICYRCRGTGHLSSQCPFKKQK